MYPTNEKLTDKKVSYLISRKIRLFFSFLRTLKYIIIFILITKKYTNTKRSSVLLLLFFLFCFG